MVRPRYAKKKSEPADEAASSTVEPPKAESVDVHMPEGPKVPPVPLPQWVAIPCPKHWTAIPCETCGSVGAVRVDLYALKEWKP